MFRIDQHGWNVIGPGCDLCGCTVSVGRVNAWDRWSLEICYGCLERLRATLKLLYKNALADKPRVARRTP